MTRPSTGEAAEARRSALTVAGVLALITAWSLYRDRESLALSVGVASGALLVVGVFWARGAVLFHRVWMGLAHALGWINSRILLSVLFYFIVTPIGLVQRIFGRDPLRRRAERTESYWVPRKAKSQSREQFERLF